MLDQITPVILTYNEAPNIARTLERLDWAREIVLVDSLSDDETVAIAKSFSQVRLYQRPFDTFAAQWTFALKETAIATDWVLGLDADFLLTTELIAELAALQPPAATRAYKAPLKYCVAGRPLRFSLLPPLIVLYQRGATTFFPDAHTYRVNVAGEVGMLNASVLHDDRKSLRHWFHAQQGYAQLEAGKILSTATDALNSPDRIRRLRIVAPIAVFFYCLIRGGILDGYPGLYYAIQRALAELMLSLYLLENDLRIKNRRRDDIASGETSRGASICDESADAAS